MDPVCNEALLPRVTGPGIHIIFVVHGSAYVLQQGAEYSRTCVKRLVEPQTSNERTTTYQE